MQNRQYEEALKKLKKEFICPVTRESFVRPVSLPCGHNIEEDALRAWLSNNSTCPCCRAAIPAAITTTLAVNHTLQAVMAFFYDTQPAIFFSNYSVAQLIKEGETEKVIEILTARPKKINSRLIEGNTALHLAVQEGNFDLVRALIENFKESIDINARIECPGQSADGRTPMYVAAREKKASVAIVEYLIKKGADPSISSKQGLTPLMTAVLNKKYDRVVALIHSGKDLNINLTVTIKDHDEGKTALIFAIEHCDVQTFSKVLSVKEIDVNVKNAKAESALFVAASRGDVEKVKMLLTMPGVDIEAKRVPGDGKTAMQIAQENRHAHVVALFACYDFIDRLLQGKTIQEKMKLDYLVQLDQESLNSIFQCLISQGHEKKNVEQMASFINRLRQYDAQGQCRSEEAANQYNFFAQEQIHEINILNLLYRIAHRSYYSNEYNWEVIIRKEALHQLKETLPELDHEERLAKLKRAKLQGVIHDHRHRFSLGRTAAMREIDAMIKQEERAVVSGNGMKKNTG